MQIKNVLIALFVCTSLTVKAQELDSIKISRSELIHFATNSIKLKSCNENYLLKEKHLSECNSTLAKSIKINLINDTIINNYKTVLANSESRSNKAQRNVRTWKSVSLVGFTAFAGSLIYIFTKH